MKLAVIPARGQSMRIPRKNIRGFHGRPIIAYSILAALESKLFDRVVVSTDDEEIAKVAREWGAETPFMRPSSLADDYTGTNAVVKHALLWFSERSQVFDFACCIYATAPFLEPDYLRKGLEQLVASGKAFSFSVTSFAFPIRRALQIKTDGSVEAMFPEYATTRSQDLEHAYHDAGQFYWGRAESFLRDVVLFSNESIAVILPRHKVQDIDTPEDWQQAEHLFGALKFERSEGS